MAGHGSLQGAAAKVTDLQADRIAVVEFNGMPGLPPGKVYELWLIPMSGASPMPAGTFMPDEKGGAIMMDHAMPAGTGCFASEICSLFTTFPVSLSEMINRLSGPWPLVSPAHSSRSPGRKAIPA